MKITVKLQLVLFVLLGGGLYRQVIAQDDSLASSFLSGKFNCKNFILEDGDKKINIKIKYLAENQSSHFIFHIKLFFIV